MLGCKHSLVSCILLRLVDRLYSIRWLAMETIQPCVQSPLEKLVDLGLSFCHFLSDFMTENFWRLSQAKFISPVRQFVERSIICGKGCSFLVEPSLGLVLKSSFCNFNCLNDPLRYWSV